MFVSRLSALLLAGGWLTAQLASAQPAQPLPLTSLSAFRQPVSANWSLAENVNADLTKPNTLSALAGTGILVCQPTGKYGLQYNLLTEQEHGDADVELDFMMAKGANSGVYLQGRYEVQLFDSWGKLNPSTVDVGSIYERWDDSRPDGQKGYEGHPARQNAGKAPGLWQHLRVVFQAPRFDASGKKIEHARFLRVELNGVLVQENVVVTGPTRAAQYDDEKARGPLMLQGDHGAVAFKNIAITTFEGIKPTLRSLNYAVYKGDTRNEPTYAGMTPDARGTSDVLSTAAVRPANNYVLHYVGTLRVAQPGEYQFQLRAPYGSSRLKINNQSVGGWNEWTNGGKVTLPAGDLPFELTYAKYLDWGPGAIELSGECPGIRRFLLTPAEAAQEETDPILVTAETNTLLRSFMDLPQVRAAQKQPYRVTHAISVGSPTQVHYTYDADNGSIVQVWRGQFLDATPMWNDRGDGSSRPMGAVSYLGGKPQLMLARLASTQTPWPTDTLNSGFRPKGYSLDEQDRPTFRYVVGGASVADQVRPLPDGHGLQRELIVAQPGTNLYARLASGETIETLPNSTYLIDGKTYLIQVTDSASQPFVRTSNGRQELLVPVAGKLSYSILF
jgi:hypothetical protein